MTASPSVQEKEALPFDELADAELVVDARYDGGVTKTVADDPIAKLLPVGNMGGFRTAGSPRKGAVRLAVLFTTTGHFDWPDSLDPRTGVFTYYGDNRRPGHELHDTQRSGNWLLRDAFARTHASSDERRRVPPFLVFESTTPGRRVVFRGLAAPGAANLTSDDDLAAIWRSTSGERFQNYRSRFTILDLAHVPRAWLDDVLAGVVPVESPHCPQPWRRWVDERAYTPLAAPATTVVRSKPQQLPTDAQGRAVLDAIREHFRDREHDFEACAVELWRLIAPATGRCEQTRPSRDGGRDAIGEYVLGPPSDPIAIDFALEAKCYSDTTAVRVPHMARLISRLRHRNFGVLVTTSYVDPQTYTEVRDDQHPIAIVTGRDIVDTLRAHGHADLDAVRRWLHPF